MGPLTGAVVQVRHYAKKIEDCRRYWIRVGLVNLGKVIEICTGGPNDKAFFPPRQSQNALAGFRKTSFPDLLLSTHLSGAAKTRQNFNSAGCPFRIYPELFLYSTRSAGRLR